MDKFKTLRYVSRPALDTTAMRDAIDQRWRQVARTQGQAMETLALEAVRASALDRVAMVECPSRALTVVTVDGKPFQGMCVHTAYAEDEVTVLIRPLDEVWPDWRSAEVFT